MTPKKEKRIVILARIIDQLSMAIIQETWDHSNNAYALIENAFNDLVKLQVKTHGELE